MTDWFALFNLGAQELEGTKKGTWTGVGSGKEERRKRRVVLGADSGEKAKNMEEGHSQLGPGYSVHEAQGWFFSFCFLFFFFTSSADCGKGIESVSLGLHELNEWKVIC